MALSVKVGNFAAKTTNGSQAITGVGFQPKLLIFVVQNRTTDGDDASSGKLGFGIGVTSSSRVALGVADAARRHDNGSCLVLVNGAGTVILAADLTSMDSDGFTLNWTTTSGAAPIMLYIAVGGADLTNVGLVQFTSPTSTGSQATTGMGFKPDCLLLCSVGLSTAPAATDATKGRFGVGWGTSSSARVTAGMALNTSGAADARKKQSTSAILTIPTDAATTNFIEADLTSLDSDGFTLNWGTVDASAHYCWGLGLKGGSYKVGSFLQPTSNGNQGVTGVGFQPVGEILLATSDTAAAGVTSEIRNTIAGATSSSDRWVVGKGSIDVSNDCINMDRTLCIRNLDEVVGNTAVLSKADFVSQDADGFTVNWTTTDATQREQLYLALGSGGGGGGGPPASAPPPGGTSRALMGVGI